MKNNDNFISEVPGQILHTGRRQFTVSQTRVHILYLKHCTGLRTQERHIHDLHLCRQALWQWPKFFEVGLWGCCLHRKLYSGQCSTAAISWAHVLAIRQSPKTE